MDREDVFRRGLIFADGYNDGRGCVNYDRAIYGFREVIKESRVSFDYGAEGYLAWKDRFLSEFSFTFGRGIRAVLLNEGIGVTECSLQTPRCSVFMPVFVVRMFAFLDEVEKMELNDVEGLRKVEDALRQAMRAQEWLCELDWLRCFNEPIGEFTCRVHRVLSRRVSFLVEHKEVEGTVDLFS